MCFVIGGSLGLSDVVLERSNFGLSFSDMTFPHQLMRLVLVEQLTYQENKYSVFLFIISKRKDVVGPKILLKSTPYLQGKYHAIVEIIYVPNRDSL